MKKSAGRIVKSLALIFLLGASLASAQDPWNKRVSGGNVVTDDEKQVCVDSMNRGRACAVRARPNGFLLDYSVSFDFRLDTDNNHWLVVYFDEFVYLNIDWRTELKSWNNKVPSVLGKLETGRWYRIKIDAHPSRKTYDVFLDGLKVGTAVNVEPGKRVPGQPSLQEAAEGEILIGDYENTDFNRGKACWKNFSLPSAGSGEKSRVSDESWILDGVWNYEGTYEIEARHEEFGSWVFKTKPKILIVEWWLDFSLRSFGHKARKTVTYDLTWTEDGFTAVFVDEKGGKSVIEAHWWENVKLKGRYYDLKPGQDVPDPENPVSFYAHRVSDDPRTGLQ